MRRIPSTSENVDEPESGDALLGRGGILAISLATGIALFPVVVRVGHTPLPLVSFVLLLSFVVSTYMGYSNRAFSTAVLAGVFPVCCLALSVFVEYPPDPSYIVYYPKLVVLTLGPMVPALTGAFIGGRILHDRAVLSENTRYILSRTLVGLLIFTISAVCYLLGLLKVGRVN